MDLVDDLVLTPFKEIVDKAGTAVENAGDENVDMLKASQSLLKEGQRALKRIEPLCKKQFEEYGTNFTDTLKENGKDSFWACHTYTGGGPSPTDAYSVQTS